MSEDGTDCQVEALRGPRLATDLDAHIGNQIRLRRLVLGLSQQTLAGRLGITFQQIQKYESGANRISASRLFLLGQQLGVPLQYFFEGANVDEPVSGAADPADIMAILGSRDGATLIRGFLALKNPVLRRAVVQFITTVAQEGIETSCEE
jgi:transcriptional regulator with XRE-family HTH domain